MTVALFPGQGSQFRGMGHELFDQFPALEATADAVLGYSIRELCVEDPRGQLDFTLYTQPALYVVNAMTHLARMAAGAASPQYAAGHSLGEYNALLAAGAYDFETGLRLVKRRAELMSRASGGGMAAVLGKTGAEIREVMGSAGITDVDIANLNTPNQIVLSGREERIAEIQGVFQAAGARYVQLRVTGAFHSRYMREAERDFGAFVNQFEFRPLAFPVVANVTARPYVRGRVKDTLVTQISSPVKWCESIRYLLGKGQNEFVQDGPGDVLTNMLRAIRRQTTPLIVDDEPEDVMEPEQVEVRPQPSFARDQTPTPPRPTGPGARLGSESFKLALGTSMAIVTGGMYRGISTPELLTKVARAGMLGFYGTSGQSDAEINDAIRHLNDELGVGGRFGASVTYRTGSDERETALIDLLLRQGVRFLEASGYVSVTASLVRYRLCGVHRSSTQDVIVPNRVLAKVSRPEVAEAFLKPCPEPLVAQLRSQGLITAEEAELASRIPVASDLTVVADSASHTDRGVATALFPAITRVRDDAVASRGWKDPIHVGLAGGIGTPSAAAAAFIMGADYVLTGSINQCTVEAGTSDIVKSILQSLNVQDTSYAPAGDLLDFGSEMQVVRRGVLFPARARKLHDLYRRHSAIDEIDPRTSEQLESRYFRRPLAEVLEQCLAQLPADEAAAVRKDPRQSMKRIFQWYFDRATELALAGESSEQVDFQIPCGPALGAFNQWVKGSELEDWHQRHVDDINCRLMDGAAELLAARAAQLQAVDGR